MLVTGANGGIGLAMARERGEAGADLALWGRDEAENAAVEQLSTARRASWWTSRYDPPTLQSGNGRTSMGWRVVVDFDLCESNAVCMGVAPEVFEVRDDDFLYVLDETPPDELRPKVEDAVARCPKQAISIAED